MILVAAAGTARADAPNYATQVAPLLKKYCAGCHSGADAEAGLVLDRHDRILRGGESGPAVLPGRAGESLLIRVLSGTIEPAMPPEDAEQPKPQEIALLRAWIDAGAKGPDGDEFAAALVVPKIEPKTRPPQSITALAFSPDGGKLAVARYGRVELLRAADQSPLRTLDGVTGRASGVSFSRDGKLLVAAAGEPGMAGEATLWSVESGERLAVFRGHSDSLYAARLSPDGNRLATGGYDQKILLWDVATQTVQHEIAGHNGPVYDLDFSPDGTILASASGDRTVKLWSAADGRRLDTLGQPLKDVLAVAFSPDGRRLAASGADRRIRIWAIDEQGQEGTNPLVHARFAHDGAVVRLAWSEDGRLLASSSDNRTVKLWDTATMLPARVLEEQPDWPAGLSLAGSSRLVVGRMDGSLGVYDLQPAGSAAQRQPQPEEGDAPAEADPAAAPETPLAEADEVEPNDAPDQAMPITVPGVVKGRFVPRDDAPYDVDLYRFDSRAGQTWIIETEAARAGSSADTKVEVLHADGQPVLRMLLAAVRDSHVNFRGFDSNNRGARLDNWEEMELNQYLYLSGEVVRLYRFPQGPDSDFLFYGAGGLRRAYFDTTPTTHYLGVPCYIVEPHAPGSNPPAVGLPVFPLYYVNDDDGQRRLGRDSSLTFTAPADGTYLVRVNEVRGAGGEKFHYKLSVRRPRPDFRLSLDGANPTVHAGSGRRIKLRVDRQDGFDGPVRVDVAGLPPGFHVTTPVVIEAGHDEAFAVLWADEDAPQPTDENGAATQVTATATIAGREVTRPAAANLGQIKLAERPKLLVRLLVEPAEGAPASGDVAAETGERSAAEPIPGNVVRIRPGEMVSALLRIERNGFQGEVKFDVDNLPHGVIVDDIGLSGILITADRTERRIFLAARPWVQPTTRSFHAVALAEGNQASPPLVLIVEPSEPPADSP